MLKRSFALHIFTGLITLSILISGAIGCQRQPEKNAKEESMGEVLLMAEDSVLTLTDVISRIPAGLSEADSLLMFHSIVKSWIENVIVADIVRENIDNYDEIERKVTKYRNQLIVNEYFSKMKISEVSEVPETKIKKYFTENADDLKLEVPLIKGIFIKTASDDDNIDKIRRWISTYSEENIDKLETYGLEHALQYDYFADRWSDWQEISNRIPYRFYDADAFLKSTRNFETTYNGSTYFLHITDYLPSGSPVPYEFARPGIAAMLRGKSMADYEKQLLHDICIHAIDEGKLQVVDKSSIKPAGLYFLQR